MNCKKCGGLVLERYGQYSCINCGADPFLKLITVKCSWVDCFALPVIDGYCEVCWGKRLRSELTRAERAQRIRDQSRASKARTRAKKKEAV